MNFQNCISEYEVLKVKYLFIHIATFIYSIMTQVVLGCHLLRGGSREGANDCSGSLKQGVSENSLPEASHKNILFCEVQKCQYLFQFLKFCEKELTKVVPCRSVAWSCYTDLDNTSFCMS